MRVILQHIFRSNHNFSFLFDAVNSYPLESLKGFVASNKLSYVSTKNSCHLIFNRDVDMIDKCFFSTK